VGVLSNHFSAVRRPTEPQLRGLQEAAELAANAIVRIRAKDHDGQTQRSLESIEQSSRAIDDAEKLLSRACRATITRPRSVET
jgi:GAF domain-containing protein